MDNPDKLSTNYKLKDDSDPATREWCRLIDFNTVVKTNLDWHSTRTFELFLDALDVNKPVIKDDKKGNPNPKTNTNTTTDSVDSRETTVSYPNDGINIKDKNADKHANGIQEEATPNSSANQHGVDRYQGVETILSAEALKILSELPDLLHMSSTRSFMFPNYGNTARK